MTDSPTATPGGDPPPPWSGQPQPTGAAYLPPQPQTSTSGKAIAALILGLGGFVVCPVVCSILAIIFGAMGRSDTRRDPMLTGEGLATAGLVLGIVGLLLWPVIVYFAVETSVW